MAVEVGFSGRNPYSRSLFERIRMSKETQWRRLLIWSAAVVATSLAVGFGRLHSSPSETVQVSVTAVAAGAAFGAAVYCLAIFALERRLRALFAATAFSALGSGTILQAAVDLHGSPPAAYSWIATLGWLFAGALFLGEAHSSSKWRATSRLQAIGQLSVAGVAVVAFPLAVLPHVLDITYFCNLSSSVSAAGACRIVDTALGLGAAALICAALRANHRRYMAETDGLAGLLCYFLIACVAGLLFYCASAARFDRWSTISQMCFMWSWIVLVVGNGIENAFAHKEAGERLEELETLHDVSWSLVGAATVKELLDLFVSTLVNKLGARIAAVYLAEDSPSLELAAICGSDETPVGKKYPLVSDKPYPGFHSGHTAKAFASKQVQIANDVFVDVEFVPWKVVAQDDGCAASIPLVDNDVCIGVLNVYFSDAADLTTTRLRLLATIAAAATSAVEYALSKQAERFPDGEDIKLAA